MNTTPPTEAESQRKKYASIVVLIAFAMQISSIVYDPNMQKLAGVAFYISLFLLWPDLKRSSRIQTSVILFLSLPGLLIGLLGSKHSLSQIAVTTNTGIVTLIIAVGFFGLSISRKPSTAQHKYLLGTRGFFSTYLNIHFVGAVINYAAVLMFTDRVAKRKPLSLLQATVISRSFASAGFWSPFFVTMAVATSYSPGHTYSSIATAGLLMAASSLAFTYVSFKNSHSPNTYIGVPYARSTILPPILVALTIVLVTTNFPNIAVIDTVTIIGVIYGLITLSTRINDSIKSYTLQRFHGYANEIALFLAAGLLNTSLLCIVHEYDHHFVTHALTFYISVAFLSSSLVLACLGIHPLISITVFVSLIEVPPDTANLMAFTLLCSWTIGSSLGPLSGQNIGISSRYGISSYHIMRQNILHSLFLVLISSIILYLI